MSAPATYLVSHWRFATPVTGAAHEAWPLVGTEDTILDNPTEDTGYAIIFKNGNSGDMSQGTQTITLQYRVDTGGGFGSWTNVSTSSSYVRTTASGDIENATSTTERLTATSRTFDESILDEATGTLVHNCGGGDDGELYFSILFRSADINESDKIQLILNGSSAGEFSLEGGIGYPEVNFPPPPPPQGTPTNWPWWDHRRDILQLI